MRKCFAEMVIFQKMKKDKILHFFACLIPSLFGLYGVSFAAGLALGKEYGDSKSSGNKWSWGDILADILGMVVGFGLGKLYLMTL